MISGGVNGDLFDRERLSERECETAFAHLFPLGFGGTDVLVEIAPAGWEQSPLVAVFHPSVEQVHREAVRMHRNIRLLTRERTLREEPPPTLEEIRAEWSDRPIDGHRELRELVGQCLWDVFSDNHEVAAPDGRLVDLGSFRGAGQFIANLLNREIGEDRYDYMAFYLGTMWVSDRADLTPVYATVFRRLSRHGFDWTFTFPRLHAFTFDDPDSPTRDVAAELQRDRERAELRELLDEGHREALERARDEPPPCTVEAYRRVYGCDPRGWPPW